MLDYITKGIAMQVCLGYNVKCIAPRYASPVRGGGFYKAHITHTYHL